MLAIHEALDAGIEMIENPKWRREQHNARKAGWDRWQNTARPELQLWCDLMPGHVFEYHKWLTDQYAPPTVNNYMNPLRKAATYVKLYHPDFARDLFVRNVIRAKHRPAAKRYLFPDQLAAAIGAARDAEEPAVYAALMFGGLAGLDIGEIMRISAKDINGNVLIVRGEKNEYRPRIIPMCAPLADFAGTWRRFFPRMPIKTDGSLSHKTRKILDQCAVDTADETFKLITLHDATRVTFVNMALQSGCENEYLRAYIGHAPETVLDRHYGDLTPREGDMPRILNGKLEQLQNRIITAIDEKVKDTAFLC